MRLIMPFFLAIVSILIVSCGDDPLLDQKDDLSLNNREKNNVEPPSLEHERLAFRNADHFYDYLSYLNTMYDTDEVDFNTIINSSDQFMSIYHIEDLDEFDSPEKIFVPAIADPVVSSILNEHYEVQVGEALVTYINDNDVLVSDVNDMELQERIRQISKGKKISNEMVPEGAYRGKDSDIKSLFGPWCGCTINIEMVDCNTARIYGTCKNTVWGDGEGTVTISINGFPLQTHQVDGNFEFFLEVGFTAMTINAKADPKCFFGNNAYANYDYVPGEDACDFGNRYTSWEWKESGNQAISYRAAAYKNYWGSFEEAKVYSYEWNGSKWKKKRAKLKVTVDAVRKNNDCFEFEQESETKSCNNCKKKRARVNAGIWGAGQFVHHCDGDVEGTYQKEKSGIIITATNSVDFNCCE